VVWSWFTFDVLYQLVEEASIDLTNICGINNFYPNFIFSFLVKIKIFLGAILIFEDSFSKVISINTILGQKHQEL
jgi:hypothetical protein